MACVIVMVAGKKPPASLYTLHNDGTELSYPQRVLHQARARSFPERKSKFDAEDTWPFREGASKQNGSLNPLRMDTATGTSTLRQTPGSKSKALPLDITIVNPRASSNLENAARHARKHLVDAVERKKKEYQGSFPAMCSFLLVLSTWSEACSDVYTLIRELAIKRIEHKSEIHSNES